jgi:hypothetical protein
MKRVPEGRSTKILKQSENDICIQTIHNHMHIIHLCNCCTGVLRVHSSRATGSIGTGTVVQTRSSEYISKRKVGVYLGVPELLLMSLYIVHNVITRRATIPENPRHESNFGYTCTSVLEYYEQEFGTRVLE